MSTLEVSPRAVSSARGWNPCAAPIYNDTNEPHDDALYAALDNLYGDDSNNCKNAP